MSIQDIVGTARYESMRSVLQGHFPDGTVTDSVVDAAFQVAKYSWQAVELQPLNIPPLSLAPIGAGAPYRYYLANATHSRTAAPGSQFTGQLPIVRFPIPDTGTSQTLPTLSSPAGDLLPEDRLFPSVDVLWATYGGDPLLTFGRPERVEMIGPPRLSGARFAAISIYLCYAKNADQAPSFYILEAGLATGEARMSFLGRSMSAGILAQSQYKPTAFSQPWHYYQGTLTMDEGAPDEPSWLRIEVCEQEPPAAQYLQVNVQYERLTTPVMTYPFVLTVEAGARVQAIADALGIPSNLDQQWFLRLLDAIGTSKLFTIPPKPVA
jgi:hypothetical protein